MVSFAYNFRQYGVIIISYGRTHVLCSCLTKTHTETEICSMGDRPMNSLFAFGSIVCTLLGLHFMSWVIRLA